MAALLKTLLALSVLGASSLLSRGESPEPLTRVRPPTDPYEEAKNSPPRFTPNPSRLVTFQLDLSTQKAIGRFPGNNTSVRVAGSFNNWSIREGYLEMIETPNNIYIGTLPISGSIGTKILYKYYLETPQIAGSSRPPNRDVETIPPRELKLEHDGINQQLDVVSFSDLEARPVVFYVNAKEQIKSKELNTETGGVIVTGDFNNWELEKGTLPLKHLGNGIYAGGAFLYGKEGSKIEYRFLNTTPNAPNGGLEIGEKNRFLTLKKPGARQNLPLTRFGSQFRMSPSNPRPPPQTVTP